MEREQDDSARATAIEMAGNIMEWEGAPLPGEGFKPPISPDQEIVFDGRIDPTHPLRKGRISTG